MTAPSDLSTRMMALQKARLTTVIRLTQENAMVLTLQQRVAGKEIEMMVVERAAELGQKPGGGGDADTHEATMELSLAREVLALHVSAVDDMERTLKNLDTEIGWCLSLNYLSCGRVRACQRRAPPRQSARQSKPFALSILGNQALARYPCQVRQISN